MFCNIIIVKASSKLNIALCFDNDANNSDVLCFQILQLKCVAYLDQEWPDNFLFLALARITSYDISYYLNEPILRFCFFLLLLFNFACMVLLLYGYI